MDDAIKETTLKVLERGAIAATLEAERQAAAQRDEVRDALSRDLEAARYAANRAFRQYDAIDPANRLVAAELERRWNQAQMRVSEVEAHIAAHDRRQPPRSEATAASFATLTEDLNWCGRHPPRMRG